MKNLPQSLCTGHFLDDDIWVVVIESTVQMLTSTTQLRFTLNTLLTQRGREVCSGLIKKGKITSPFSQYYTCISYIQYDVTS